MEPAYNRASVYDTDHARLKNKHTDRSSIMWFIFNLRREKIIFADRMVIYCKYSLITVHLIISKILKYVKMVWQKQRKLLLFLFYACQSD
jgi:hypothetical protein